LNSDGLLRVVSILRIVEMIVEFDGVASEAELDPAAFGPLLAVDDDLAGKGNRSHPLNNLRHSAKLYVIIRVT